MAGSLSRPGPPRPGGSGGSSAGPEIAYPPAPGHLGGLAPRTANIDSSSRISNDSNVASEKFKGVLYPDLGKSLRKKVFISTEYLHREKGGPLPPTTPLSNGQKIMKNIQYVKQSWCREYKNNPSKNASPKRSISTFAKLPLTGINC